MKLFTGIIILIIIALVSVAFAGCLAGANPDDQFKDAWAASEKDVISFGKDIQTPLQNMDISSVSDRSKQMISTIDTHYQQISNIQVTSKYSAAKQDYLVGLSDLRMACVSLSQMKDAEGLKAVSLGSSSIPWLKSSQEKRDKVKAIMQN